MIDHAEHMNIKTKSERTNESFAWIPGQARDDVYKIYITITMRFLNQTGLPAPSTSLRINLATLGVGGDDALVWVRLF